MRNGEDTKLNPPTIVIVGAGQGLGLAIARRFGKEGFNAALIARRRDSLEKMVSSLRAEGIVAEGFIADAADEESLTSALASVKEHFGAIDVLEFSPVPAPEGGAAYWTPTGLDRGIMDRLHRLIVLGAITSVRQVLPDMQAKRGGTIFLTTSGSAHHAMPVYTPVGMVMAGLRSYALCLNQVLAGQGIYVATVCIAVLIRKGDNVGDPSALADRYYRLYQKRQVAEEIVREDVNLNALHDRDMNERGIDWKRPEKTD